MVLFFSAWLVVDTLSVSFIPLCNDVFVVGSPYEVAGGKGKVGCLVRHLLYGHRKDLLSYTYS